MDHSGREDPKLSEVKAVLQRLQGLPAELGTVGSQAAGTKPLSGRRAVSAIIVGAAAAGLVVAFSVPSLKRMAAPAPSPKPANTSEMAKSAPTIGTDGSVIVQSATISRADDTPTAVAKPGPQTAPPKAPDRPTIGAVDPVTPPAGPQAAPATPPLPGLSARTFDPAKAALERPALEAAQGLLASGKVSAARQQLLALTADGSADVAWALARSYDPNYLATLSGADTGPDIEEAARWYRRWYAAAVRQGLVADSVSIERIIRSMRQ